MGNAEDIVQYAKIAPKPNTCCNRSLTEELQHPQ